MKKTLLIIGLLIIIATTVYLTKSFFMDTQNKLCAELKDNETLFALSAPEGQLGGYKLINNSKNVDVAYTSWYDINGVEIGSVSPISKISQEGLKRINDFETMYGKVEKIDCSK